MFKRLFLTVALLLAFVAVSLARTNVYTVRLSGGQEANPVQTRAEGEFILRVSGDQLTYRLVVTNLENAVAAHLHLGPVGAAGPVVVDLFTGPAKSGSFSGVLAEGTIMAENLKGPLLGQSLEALLTAIDEGTIYVNAHTTANPAGEIRAQVR